MRLLNKKMESRRKPIFCLSTQLNMPGLFQAVTHEDCQPPSPTSLRFGPPGLMFSPRNVTAVGTARYKSRH